MNGVTGPAARVLETGAIAPIDRSNTAKAISALAWNRANTSPH